MSYRKLLFAILFLLAIDSYASVVTVSTHVHDMEFRDLARKWDEAIPLGNATIGSLIWQKGELTKDIRSGKLGTTSKKTQTVETEIKSADALTESSGRWEPDRDAG